MTDKNKPSYLSLPAVTLGPFSIRPFSENIYINGKPFPIGGQPRTLLRYLIMHPDELIEYSKVLLVLGHDPSNVTGAHTKCIQRLRIKLRPVKLDHWLVTIPNHGIMLMTTASA